MNSKELIEKIKTEIERIRNQSAKELGDAFLDSNEPKVMASGGIAWTCEQLLSFLNTLKTEEPIVGLEEAGREWLIPQLDKSYENYGETKQMELTHFDGYAMLDAIEFGAKWQKEQMTSKAIDASCFDRFQGSALFSFRLPTDKDLVGSDVKVIVIKED